MTTPTRPATETIRRDRRRHRSPISALRARPMPARRIPGMGCSPMSWRIEASSRRPNENRRAPQSPPAYGRRATDRGHARRGPASLWELIRDHPDGFFQSPTMVTQRAASGHERSFGGTTKKACFLGVEPTKSGRKRTSALECPQLGGRPDVARRWSDSLLGAKSAAKGIVVVAACSC